MPSRWNREPEDEQQPKTSYHPMTPSPYHPRNPVAGEDVTAEEEEENGALQHGCDRGWQAKRHLDLISADRECGQQKGNKHRSQGVQPPEPGDDDRGVAIAGRKVALE